MYYELYLKLYIGRVTSIYETRIEPLLSILLITYYL